MVWAWHASPKTEASFCIAIFCNLGNRGKSSFGFFNRKISRVQLEAARRVIINLLARPTSQRQSRSADRQTDGQTDRQTDTCF